MIMHQVLSVFFSLFTVTISESNRSPLGCGRMGDLQRESVPQKFAGATWNNHVNMNRNLKGMFPAISEMHAMKKWESESLPIFGIVLV